MFVSVVLAIPSIPFVSGALPEEVRTAVPVAHNLSLPSSSEGSATWSWADASPTECAGYHPSMVFPVRSSELARNLACAHQSLIGPTMPPNLAAGAKTVSSTASAPSFGLYNSQMVYDVADHELLLFGATGSGTLNGTQTWAFSHGNWTRLNPPSTPESCFGSAMTYDNVDNYVVYLAGGNFGSGSCSSAGQTWKFSGGTWTQLFPATSPSPRLAASFTNDSADGYDVLFGGACVQGAHLGLCGDTWKYVGGSWTNITSLSTVHPSPRAGAGMTFDVSDGYVLLFGGTAWPLNIGEPLTMTDTWVFSAGTWAQVPINGTLCGGPSQPLCYPNAPPGMYNDGLTYDASDGSVLYTCAHDNGSGGWPEIYWSYHGGVWTNLNDWSLYQVNWLPSNRVAEGLAYDWGDQYSVLFGGVRTNWALLNDTWTYHADEWTNRTNNPSGAVFASASANVTSGVAPLTVGFSGSATGGTGPYNYTWSFGNGTSDVYSQYATRTFSAAGTYDANFTVQGPLEAPAHAFVVITVKNYSGPLSANISASPSAGPAPLTVTFTSTVFGGTSPYTYSWNFGDASPLSTLPDPTHTYGGPGSFIAMLTVTDKAGASLSPRLLISVNGSASNLSANISASPSSGAAPLTVAFSSIVSGGTAPYSYRWNFGDGSATSSIPDPSHTFNVTGSYLVVLNVTDSAGHSAYPRVAITVGGSLHASILFDSPSQGSAPLSVGLTGNASGGTAPYNYSWNFGDGSQGWGLTVLHTYLAPAGCATGGNCSYDVSLTVRDSQGATAASGGVITVNPGSTSLFQAGILFDSPNIGHAPLTVTVTGNATGGTGPYAYLWEFGDGSSNVSSSSTVSHTYSLPPGCGTNGTCSYVLSLQVTDAGGRVANASTVISLWPNGTGTFAASIALTPSSGPAPLPVNFTGTASGGVPPYTFVWSFGDGATATGASTRHTYVQTGTSTVILTVVDSRGTVAQISSTVQVNPPSGGTGGMLELSIGASPATGPAPLTTVLTASAQGGSPPYSFEWSFGDNSSSASGSSVTHTYTVPGVYVATLYASDSAGNEASTGVFITSNGNGTLVGNPLAAFVAVGSLRGTVPFEVTFTPVVRGGSVPYLLQWNFGDGSQVLSQFGTSVILHTYNLSGNFFPSLRVVDGKGAVAEWSSRGAGHPVTTVATTPNHALPSNRFGWGALWPGLVVLGALVVVVALLVIRRSRGIPKNASGAPDDVVERGTGPTPLLASKGETPEPMPPEPPEDDPLEDAL